MAETRNIATNPEIAVEYSQKTVPMDSKTTQTGTPRPSRKGFYTFSVNG